MSDVRKVTEGAVTSISDSDLVMCAVGGKFHPISFSSLMATVRGGIQIGGRNLLLNSAAPRSGKYGIGSYPLSEPWQPGETYTMTLYGVTIGAGHQNYIQVWNRDGTVRLFDCTKISDGVYRGSFTPSANLDLSKANSFALHNFPNGLTTETSVTRAKFERGNIATDWSPAPEDIASGAWGGGNWFIYNQLQFRQERRCA